MRGCRCHMKKRKATVFVLLLAALLLVGCVDVSGPQPSPLSTRLPSGGSASPEVFWGPELFAKGSTEFNADLALLLADLSRSAYSAESTRGVFEGWGFEGFESFNYSDSDSLGTYVNTNCFSIAHDELETGGGSSTVLCVVCRGTFTREEAMGDWLWGHQHNVFTEKDIPGIPTVKAWSNVFDFYTDVKEGLRRYVNRHPELTAAEDLKIVVTGHSLGGAAANILGADFTYGLKGGQWWSGLLEKSEIYVYTYGAIRATVEDVNYSVGYENIHNIYNYYDSFGPYGNLSATNATSFRSEFGHSDVYRSDRFHYDENHIMVTFENHDMKNYRSAMSFERTNGGLISFGCTPEHVQQGGLPTTQQPSEPTQQPSEPTQQGGARVPEGTYVAYSFGIITNSFTFYGDNRVSMNALGVVGDGTYVISNGEIIITYNTNISSETYVWRASFSMSGDSIFVAGEEMRRQN